MQLAWEQEQEIGEIQVIFNDDVNKDLINLHRHKTPYEIMPELVKDYRIEAWLDGEWVVVIEEKDNRIRRKMHKLNQAVRTDKIRLVVESTNGTPSAEVIEIRVYEK